MKNEYKVGQRWKMSLDKESHSAKITNIVDDLIEYEFINNINGYTSKAGAIDATLFELLYSEIDIKYEVQKLFND